MKAIVQNILKLGIVLCIVLLGDAVACVIPELVNTVSDSELVAKSNNIVLIKIVSVELKTDEFDQQSTVVYSAKVVERIKGFKGRELNISITYPFIVTEKELLELVDVDYEAHRLPVFWNNRASRLKIFSDCNVYPVFAPGKQYLAFLDDPYAARGFEQILVKDDDWYKYVKSLVRLNLK